MELSDAAKAAISRVVESSATSLADTLDSSGKLVKENVKELGREVIVYEGYINNGAEAILAVAALGILTKAFLFCQSVREVVDTDRYQSTDKGLAVAGIIVVAIVAFFMVVWLFESITQLMKARFAPRLFLTEYATKMLKPKSRA